MIYLQRRLLTFWLKDPPCSWVTQTRTHKHKHTYTLTAIQCREVKLSVSLWAFLPCQETHIDHMVSCVGERRNSSACELA